MTWDAKSATLGTKYGKAIGYERKGALFFNAEDAGVLFRLQGGLSKRGVYELTAMEEAPAATKVEAVTATEAATAKEAAAETKDTAAETKSAEEAAAKNRVAEEAAKDGKGTLDSSKVQDRRPVVARATRIYNEGQADASAK